MTKDKGKVVTMRREIVELLCCSLVLLTTLSPRPCVRLCARDNSLVELRPAHILRRSPYSPPDRPNASARSPFLHRLADCSCLTHRPEPVVRARTAIRDLRKPVPCSSDQRSRLFAPYHPHFALRKPLLPLRHATASIPTLSPLETPYSKLTRLVRVHKGPATTKHVE